MTVRKIPTLFERDPETKYKRLTRTYSEGLEERMPTLRPTAKWDGMCVKFEGGKLYPRYKGGFRDYVLPFDNLFRDALLVAPAPEVDGTYELCGPRVQKNPHDFPELTWIKHGAYTLADAPYTWDGLQAWLQTCEFEGVVWWAETEPVCKAKRRDYGWSWPV